MKSPRLSISRKALPLAISIAAVIPQLRAVAVDQTKGDNVNLLDLGTSWLSGTAPTSTDLAIWAGTYNTVNSLSSSFTASTPVSWLGIQVGNITGTAAGLISIGGTGASVTGSQVTLGTSGIDMSAANQNLVINAATIVVSGSAQTWNIATGRNLRLGTSGTGGANANFDGVSNTVITVTGGGVVDLNQGATSGTGFNEAAGFGGFNGKWIVGANTTLRGIRNGATAFGTNTSTDAITLSGGTLAVGGISATQGNWTWNTPITLTNATNSSIDQQIFSGTGRSLKLMGTISGSGNLTFRESGATNSFDNDDLGFIVTGTNSMSGTVTIGGATENGIAGRLTSVRLGGNTGATDTTTTAGTTGDLGTAAVINNGTLTLSRSNTWTFSNTVSGTGSLRIGGGVSGASTQIVTVSGANTYSGTTSVGAGRMNLTGTLTSATSVSSGAAISGTGSTTGLLTFAGGTQLFLTGGGTTTSLTSNGVTFSTATAATFLTTPTAATTYDVLTYGAGAVTNPSNLSVNAHGTLNNTGTKFTFLADGAQTRTWNTTNGTWQNGVTTPWAEGDKVFYDLDNVVFNEPTAASTVTLSGRLAPGSVVVANSANQYTFSGIAATNEIAGTTSLVKRNAGTLVISSAQTYSGGTVLSGGTIVANDAGALGSGNVTINDANTLTNNTTLLLGNVTMARPITVANLGSGTVTLGSVATAALPTFSGAVTLAKNVTLDGTGNTDRLTFTGGIGGTGNVTIAGGADRVVFATTANTYDGTTTIAANSILQLGTGGAAAVSFIPDTSVVNLLSGSFLKLAKGANSETIGGLTGTGIVRGQESVASTASALVIDNSQNQTFSGTLEDGGASGSTLSLTKTGIGTQTLSGTNTYTGGTTINGGTLAISGGNAIANTGAVTIGNFSGATFKLNASETIGNLSGGGTTGGLVDIGGNTLTVASSAGVQVLAAAISGSGAFIKGGTGELALEGNNTFSGDITVTNATLAFRGINSASGKPAVQIDATGNLALGSGFPGQTATISKLSGSGGVNPQFDAPAGTKTLEVEQSANTIFSGVMRDATSGAVRLLAFTKSGIGTLELSGANTYTGATTISNGTLLVSGSLSGSSAVNINGGTLAGDGPVGPVTLNAGGIIAPGVGLATLASGNLNFNGGTLALQLNGTTAGSQYDQLSATGTVAFSANTPLTISLGFDPQDGVDAFTIVINDLADTVNTTSGLFSFAGTPLAQGAIFNVSGQNFSISYTGGDGNDVVLSAVPEPSAALMLLGGTGMLLGFRRRRKN